MEDGVVASHGLSISPCHTKVRSIKTREFEDTVTSDKKVKTTDA